MFLLFRFYSNHFFISFIIFLLGYELVLSLIKLLLLLLLLLLLFSLLSFLLLSSLDFPTLVVITTYSVVVLYMVDDANGDYYYFY